MNRKIDGSLIIGIAKNIKYLPAIVLALKNWPTYLLHYLGLRNGGGAFRFRNGVVIRDNEGTASGTIAVVFIRKHYGSVADKSIVVEIGANIGTFAIYAAAGNKNAKLYSYEPVKSNYDVLIKNIEENGYQDRISAFKFAVAAKAEKRTLYLQDSPEHSFSSSGTHYRSISVNCISLKDILQSNKIDKVDLLKINAEGAEYEILYATPKDCFEKIAEIRMEYHEDETKGNDVASLQAFLEGYGYVTTYLYRHLEYEGFLWMARAR